MKRIMTSILALTLAASMCVPAFAENQAQITNDTMDATIEVTGNFNAADEADTVIFADVTWDDLTFTYQDGDKSWDAVNHKDIVGEGKWVWSSAEETKTAPAITVTNHSNTKILATFDFAAELDGIEGTFTKKEIGLNSAVGTALNNAPTGSVEFSVSGSKISEDQKIGTITVTVEADDYTPVSTEGELDDAISEGKTKIRLKNTITITGDTTYFVNHDCTIDLNGFAINTEWSEGSTLFSVFSPNYFTVRNGSISVTKEPGIAIRINEPYPVFRAENCEFYAETRYPVDVEKATAYFDNCKLRTDGDWGSLYAPAANVTFGGNIEITGGSDGLETDADSKIICLPGTYNFDPTVYVDTDIYSVTTDGTTWTVTEK